VLDRGSPVRFDEIWLLLMLMLICCERKIMFVCWKYCWSSVAE